MARLKSICRIIVDGDWIESKDQSESGIRLIQTGNIGIGEYLDKSNRAKYITAETFERLKCTEVFPGDILISRLPDPIGRACAVPQNVGKAITAVDCTIVRLDSSVCDINYFINYTQSARYSNELSKYLAGTTRTRISRKNLEKIEIPLPSLEEQRRIAALLDKVSDLIAKRRAQLDKLDLLVKARFVEMFGDPLIDSGRYLKVSLGSLVEVGSSKRIFEREYVNEGIPFYRTKEIVELSKGNRITTELFITKQRYDEIRKEYGVPKAGDLLISAVGTIGVIWIVDGRTDFYFKDGNLLRVTINEKFTPIYLKYLLEALIGAYKLEMSSGTAYAALTISALKEMLVYEVPIKEQKQFAFFVEQTDKLKLTIQQSLDKLETLKKALMQEYFG